MTSINQLKNLAATPEDEPKKPTSRRLQKMHDFDFMVTRENAARFIPFVFYVSFWVILYIANHHYGEKTLTGIDKLEKETKELKADFYTVNAQLSNKSIQSEVAKLVEPQGLKPLITPPKRLKLVTEDKQ
jgi:hypothetical protein